MQGLGAHSFCEVLAEVFLGITFIKYNALIIEVYVEPRLSLGIVPPGEHYISTLSGVQYADGICGRGFDGAPTIHLDWLQPRPIHHEGNAGNSSHVDEAKPRLGRFPGQNGFHVRHGHVCAVEGKGGHLHGAVESAAAVDLQGVGDRLIAKAGPGSVPLKDVGLVAMKPVAYKEQGIVVVFLSRF